MSDFADLVRLAAAEKSRASGLKAGLEAVRDIGRWILYGAMIVVPIWLVVRLFRTAR